MEIWNFLAGAGVMALGVLFGSVATSMGHSKKDESEGVITNVFTPDPSLTDTEVLKATKGPIAQRY